MRIPHNRVLGPVLMLSWGALAGTLLSGSAQGQMVSTRPASARIATSQPAAVSQSASAPTTQGTTKRRPYTAPGASVRGMSLGQAAVALSLGAAATPATSGKEASESAFSNSSRSGDFTGRSGLQAPPTISANAVNTRSGIVPGRGGALGFAGRNTLLTARPNPLSGANGVAAALSRANFPASSIAGVRNFGR